MNNDDELVVQAQSGNDDAFTRLIEKYSPLISSIVRKYFLAGFEAEDWMQIGYVSLIKAIKGYKVDARASFSTYLYMVVSGDIKNEVTKAKNNKHLALNNSYSLDVSFDDDEEDSFSPWAYLFIDENASIEDEVINKQKVQILLDELKQKLDMQERKILSKYLQGYKYSEIAQKLNVSTKKVDNTITKAKKLVSKYKND